MSGPDPTIEEERRAETSRWLAVALDDAAIAVLFLEAFEPRLAGAAYHCQQAVEKRLKCLLVIASSPFPKTHDLRNLVASVIPLYPNHSDLLSSTAPMTTWQVVYRYPVPEDYEVPSPEEVRQALSTIDEVVAVVRVAIAP